MVGVVGELCVSNDLVRRVDDVDHLYVDHYAISLRCYALLGLNVIIGMKRCAVRNECHVGLHCADPLS